MTSFQIHEARGEVATRAIDTADQAGNISHQLTGWRETIDAAFILQWNDLAAHAGEPNAFFESWFLRPALEQFDCAGAIRLFALWDAGTLCGLMPVAAPSQYGRWPIPHVVNWLHHNAFLGTPLVRFGYEMAFWVALFEQLDNEPGQALFAHIQCLDLNGKSTAALSQLCTQQNRRCALVHRTERALLRHGLSVEAHYETAVRAKKRKELRRQKVRLSEEGELTFSRDDSDIGALEWADEFLALEMRGWKGANGSALATASQTRALFCEVLKGAAAAGRLERLDLRLNGKPLAMLVNFLCPPAGFSFKTTFAEDYARFSPGVLLQIENFELLHNAHVQYCDSCASEGHPMIDSLWTDRRAIGRYSVAIGGSGRRAIFSGVLKAELARSKVTTTEALAEERGEK
jgi:hypothetical protein